MRSHRFAALSTTAAAAALFLAACGGGTEDPGTPEPTVAPTTQAPTEEPTTEAPTTEAPTAEEPTTEAPATEEPTTGSAGEDSWDIRPGDEPISSENFPTGGGDLFLSAADATVRDMGLQTQFTFTGDLDLQWQAEFVEEAHQQGSGMPIDMGEAEHILQITVAGLRYPEPTEEVITSVEAPDMPGAVIVVDPPFEGMSVIYIGVPDVEVATIQLLQEDGQTVLSALL